MLLQQRSLFLAHQPQQQHDSSVISKLEILRVNNNNSSSVQQQQQFDASAIMYCEAQFGRSVLMIQMNGNNNKWKKVITRKRNNKVLFSNNSKNMI